MISCRTALPRKWRWYIALHIWCLANCLDTLFSVSPVNYQKLKFVIPIYFSEFTWSKHWFTRIQYSNIDEWIPPDIWWTINQCFPICSEWYLLLRIFIYIEFIWYRDRMSLLIPNSNSNTNRMFVECMVHIPISLVLFGKPFVTPIAVSPSMHYALSYMKKKRTLQVQISVRSIVKSNGSLYVCSIMAPFEAHTFS